MLFDSLLDWVGVIESDKFWLLQFDTLKSTTGVLHKKLNLLTKMGKED